MKKLSLILVLLVIAAVLISLTAPLDKMQEGIVFYYEREKYGYGQENGVIGAEYRDISLHDRDLSYLLALYLEGPLDEGLRDPFPQSAEILSLERHGKVIHLELSDLKNDMNDAQFSLACACLTKTCLELTDVHTLLISSGDRLVRMRADNLNFYDESSSVEMPETEETE